MDAKGTLAFFVGIAILVMAMSAPMILSKKESNKHNNINAKAGLEECPIERGSYSTIWVKDCIAYTKTYKD